MAQSYANALAYSSQWLEIIKRQTPPEDAQAKWIIDESKRNFAEHFNKGWLEDRKSVTEAADWAEVTLSPAWRPCLLSAVPGTKRETMDISILATIAFTVIPTAAIVVLYLMMKGKKK